VAYIRQPLKGIVIRYKLIKGKEYAYQVVKSWRDKETGKVCKTERYLGAKKPARLPPIMDALNATDIKHITNAWQSGESISWIQTYVKKALHDEPSPVTVYNWLRKHNISRSKCIEPKVRTERKAAQARRRLAVMDEMGAVA